MATAVHRASLSGYNMTIGGGTFATGEDPSYTRWLPLSFSPLVNSQPFRIMPDPPLPLGTVPPLPPPWGNVHCFYSLSLHEETTPNLDLNGYNLSYRPRFTSDDPGIGSYLSLPGPMVPKRVITDANGQRLVFDLNGAPYEDIYSSLQPNGNGYFMDGVGPPGALRYKGYYQVNFATTSGMGQPLKARLSSISDTHGNAQNLTWNDSAGLLDPFLTVVDATSGRRLLFYRNAAGYVSTVVAPQLGSNTPATRTELTYDTGGHLTAMRVYEGNTQNLLTEELFSYAGDALAGVQQNNTTLAYTYFLDNLLRDPLDLPTPRVQSILAGTLADTSSSDNGTSVQGTWNFTYGHLLGGYNLWGEVKRTNTVTDPRGHTTQTVYSLSDDTFGSITGLRVTAPPYEQFAADTNRALATFTPSIANPQLMKVWDALNNNGIRTGFTEVEQDAFGNVKRVKVPAGHEWTWEYDTNGKNLLSATDPTNITLRFGYGEQGNSPSRLTSVTDPALLKRVELDYNTFGQLTEIKIPQNASATGQVETTTFVYDDDIPSIPIKRGELRTVIDPLGDMLTIDAYTALGDPLSSTVYPDTGNPVTASPNNRLTSTQVLNAAQLVTSRTLSNGVQVHNTWDDRQLKQMETKAPAGAGGQTLAKAWVQHDTRGRLYRAEDLAGMAAQYRYDRSSNLTQIWDGKGNITRFTYGKNDEPLTVLWPDSATATLHYDKAGRLAWAQDERGVICEFIYGTSGNSTEIDRLKEIHILPTANTPGENVTYTYDASGRVLSVTDGSGSRTYTYDPVRKRLTRVTTVLSGLPAGSNTFTLDYLYKSDGSVWKTLSSVVGTSEYTYNKAGQLVSLLDPFGDVTNWTYDHAGRLLTELTTTYAGAALRNEYTWGASGQANDPSPAPAYPNTIYQTVNNNWFYRYTLTHTYLGQVKRQNGQGAAAAHNGFELFDYDLRGRLVSEADHYQTDATHLYDKTGLYGYDLANNLHGGGVNGFPPGWSYNASNQLTGAPPYSGMSGGTGLSYDVSGNLTSLSGQTLTWDGWGRLTGVGTVTFGYDSAGRRVRKTVNGVSTYYIYDGSALIAEIDSQGYLLKAYVWGVSGLLSHHRSLLTGGGGLGGFSSSALGGGFSQWDSRYYFFDALGNTRALVNRFGSLLERGAWGAWGEAYGSNTITSAFGWKGAFGQYRDSETGLIYLNARYYSPALGRFLSRDPIGFSGGINLYGYCSDNPVNFFDLDGLEGELAVTRFMDWSRPWNPVLGDIRYVPL